MGEEVASLLSAVPAGETVCADAPRLNAREDLRAWCSPIEDQRTIEIKHAAATKQTKGALIIRNSWGTGWGDRGYGYLPYEYVLQRAAVDWWVLIKAEWLDQEPFKR